MKLRPIGRQVGSRPLKNLVNVVSHLFASQTESEDTTRPVHTPPQSSRALYTPFAARVKDIFGAARLHRAPLRQRPAAVRGDSGVDLPHQPARFTERVDNARVGAHVVVA